MRALCKPPDCPKRDRDERIFNHDIYTPLPILVCPRHNSARLCLLGLSPLTPVKFKPETGPEDWSDTMRTGVSEDRHIRAQSPGSREAIERGCSCDPVENLHGEGRPGPSGFRLFVPDDQCPLHGLGAEFDTGRRTLHRSSQHVRPRPPVAQSATGIRAVRASHAG